MPQRILAEQISGLMVEAGGVNRQLQEALAYVQAESYEKAARSLLAFSEEIEGQTLSRERGEKLSIAAKKIMKPW